MRQVVAPPATARAPAEFDPLLHQRHNSPSDRAGEAIVVDRNSRRVPACVTIGTEFACKQRTHPGGPIFESWQAGYHLTDSCSVQRLQSFLVSERSSPTRRRNARYDRR